MRKWIRNISVLAGFIITVTAVLCCAGTAAARAEETADGNGSLINRFNIMLVMDASGSMKDTDPEGWRYDAVDRFVSAGGTGELSGRTYLFQSCYNLRGTAAGQ